MSERKLGSVTYREVDRGLLRASGAPATCRACGPSGRSASGPSSPATTTAGTSASEPAGSGACWSPAVVIAVMYYGLVLLDRRDVAGPPAHGRRLLVRPIGDGPVGRVPHRPGREHGVRHHAGRRRRRDGSADAAIDRRSDARSNVAGIPGGTACRSGGRSSTSIFVGINIVGIEATMRFTVVITVLSLAILAFFFVAALVSGKFDSEPAGRTSRRRRRRSRRRRAVPPVRDRRHLQGTTVRDLVLPRDRGGAAGGRGVDGPASRRPQGLDAGGCTRC